MIEQPSLGHRDAQRYVAIATAITMDEFDVVESLTGEVFAWPRPPRRHSRPLLFPSPPAGPGFAPAPPAGQDPARSGRPIIPLEPHLPQRLQTPARSAESCGKSSLFLLKRFVFVVIQVAIHPRQLQRFHADHLVLGSTLIAGDHVAFFHFVHFDVKSILAFRTVGHDSLLSLQAISLS